MVRRGLCCSASHQAIVVMCQVPASGSAIGEIALGVRGSRAARLRAARLIHAMVVRG
jgi:hypothetical protein